MSASLSLDGAKELADALTALPDEWARSTLAPIVRQSADSLAADVKSQYATNKRTSRNPGTLVERVVVEPGRDPRGLRAKVRTKAPHAHLYEYGTVLRRTNETGASRGTMPANPVFVPTAIRWRARMVQRVAAAMRSLRIPGFTGTPEVRES